MVCPPRKVSYPSLHPLWILWQCSPSCLLYIAYRHNWGAGETLILVCCKETIKYHTATGKGFSLSLSAFKKEQNSSQTLLRVTVSFVIPFASLPPLKKTPSFSVDILESILEVTHRMGNCLGGLHFEKQTCSTVTLLLVFGLEEPIKKLHWSLPLRTHSRMFYPRHFPPSTTGFVPVLDDCTTNNLSYILSHPIS